MTTFHVPLPDAIRRLEEAAKTIDEVMDWSSSSDGPDWWQDVHDTILGEVSEAELQAQGANNKAHPAPVTTAPPPLHTLVPKKQAATGGSRFTPPPLDKLLQKKTHNNQTAIPTAIPKEEVVHIWHNGGSLCGLSGNFTNWPAGHYRVNIDEAHRASCGACAAKMQELEAAGNV